MCEYYDKMKQAPSWALRPIQAGRLKGKTDINPQWRYEKLTELFGTCGIGWKYEIVDLQTIPSAGGEIAAFAKINLYIKINDKWSDAIPGIGGSMLVEKEKSGMHTNDECYKMAVTDALSVATKMLGMAADVYKGLWDGTKYNKTKEDYAEQPQQAPKKDNRPLPERYEAGLKKLKSLSPDEYSQMKPEHKQAFNKLAKELSDIGSAGWAENILSEITRLTAVDTALEFLEGKPKQDYRI